MCCGTSGPGGGGGRQPLQVGAIAAAPAPVAAGVAAGAAAGSVLANLPGTVTYSVLPGGGLAVDPVSGALTTTGAAPSSGAITARVLADNGLRIVGMLVSVPVQAAAGVTTTMTFQTA